MSLGAYVLCWVLVSGHGEVQIPGYVVGELDQYEMEVQFDEYKLRELNVDPTEYRSVVISKAKCVAE